MTTGGPALIVSIPHVREQNGEQGICHQDGTDRDHDRAGRAGSKALGVGFDTQAKMTRYQRNNGAEGEAFQQANAVVLDRDGTRQSVQELLVADTQRELCRRPGAVAITWSYDAFSPFGSTNTSRASDTCTELRIWSMTSRNRSAGALDGFTLSWSRSPKPQPSRSAQG